MGKKQKCNKKRTSDSSESSKQECKKKKAVKKLSPNLTVEIATIAKKIRENPAKSNSLLDVFKASQNEDDAVVIASCNAIKDIFTHFIETSKYLDAKELDQEITEQSKAKSRYAQDSDEIFNSWLMTQHSVACDILFDHLDHESSEIQNIALESLAGILEAEMGLKTNGALCDSQKIVETLISYLMKSEINKKELSQQLPNLLSVQGQENDELIVFALQCLKKQIKQLKPSSSDIVLSNTWYIIGKISSASPQPGDKAKNLLTAVVCKFLRHKMPVKLYKDILTEISSVMEKMSSPLRLADFLTESFSIGGAISLMSLNALFILMHQYNLNYPDFYGKLYSMFQPQIFGAKYRSRFFHLADLFLSSTHLPAYLVAAFTKRLARLTLHAPATAAQIAVPFILNLIKRHPACEILLHRAEGKTEFDCDPFLEEASLNDCQALESCLWELQALERHFDPNLSTKAKKRTIREEDLSTYLDCSAQDIVEKEAKKIKQSIPVTFEKYTSLNLPRAFVL